MVKLTLFLKIADEVALSSESVLHLLGQEVLGWRPLDSELGLLFDHLCVNLAVNKTWLD